MVSYSVPSLSYTGNTDICYMLAESSC